MTRTTSHPSRSCAATTRVGGVAACILGLFTYAPLLRAACNVQPVSNQVAASASGDNCANPAATTISGIVSFGGSHAGVVGSVASVSVSNNGTIILTGGYNGVETLQANSTGINNGTITGTSLNGAWGMVSGNGKANTTLTNSGTINLSGITDTDGIYSRGVGNSVSNSGTVSINGTADAGIRISGTALSVVNTGTISISGANSYGIRNNGSIGTLSNSQGAGNAAGALTYTGALPTNYNIIINGSDRFGRLNATAISGSTTFGILGGSTIAQKTYSSVLSGFAAANLTGTSGTYGVYSWRIQPVDATH